MISDKAILKLVEFDIRPIFQKCSDKDKSLIINELKKLELPININFTFNKIDDENKKMYLTYNLTMSNEDNELIHVSTKTVWLKHVLKHLDNLNIEKIIIYQPITLEEYKDGD